MGLVKLKQVAQSGAANGDVATFNTGTGEWEPQALAGGGDVSAALNIADNNIVRGDGGVKGVQGNQANQVFTQADNGKVTLQATLTAGGLQDYLFDLQNLQATAGGSVGRGFRILAGEATGDIIMHLNDSDDSFGGTGGAIMEVEADQGHITFFKSYAQTLIDRGIVYGVDQQSPGATKDFNSQFGGYRAGGVIRFIAEFDNGLSGAAETIDWNVTNKQLSTLSATTTFTFTAPTDGVGNFLLRLVQDVTGNHDITWPANVKWPGGTPPNLQSAGGTEHIVSFYYNGTDYYGVASALFA